MPSAPTVRDYAERWLDARATLAAAATLRTTRGDLARYVLPLVGDVPLDAVTPEHVACVQRAILATRSGSGARTALHGTLGGVVRAARREGLLAHNPLAGLRWPEHQRQEPDPFSEAEAEAILEHYREHREYGARVLVPLVLLAGLRPSEAAGLTWRDVRWATGVCRVRGALVGGERTRGRSDNAPRRIALAPRLVELLREATRGRRRTGTLVTTRRGGALNAAKYDGLRFADALRTLEIRPRAFFQLRHTFVALNLARGAHHGAVAAYCGTRPDYLAGVYARWLPAQQATEQQQGSDDSSPASGPPATWQDGLGVF